jgi:hypothetical protein
MSKHGFAAVFFVTTVLRMRQASRVKGWAPGISQRPAT